MCSLSHRSLRRTQDWSQIQVGSVKMEREEHVQRILRERIIPDLMREMPLGQDHITEVEQTMWDVSLHPFASEEVAHS